jgi:hypothetical protein
VPWAKEKTKRSNVTSDVNLLLVLVAVMLILEVVAVARERNSLMASYFQDLATKGIKAN